MYLIQVSCASLQKLVSEIGIEHVRELLRLAVYDRETLGRLLASLDDPITLH